MCTDPDYPDELVYRAHKLRWKIEEGYREMRQHHGFGAFHSRDWNAIYGHLTFAFLSLLLTTAIRRFNQRIATQTLGWVKEHYLNAVGDYTPGLGIPLASALGAEGGALIFQPKTLKGIKAQAEAAGKAAL